MTFSFKTRMLVLILLMGLGGMGFEIKSAWCFSSTNVPLDHWSYRAIEKLVGFGLIQSDLKGTLPWSREEMARLIVEAKTNKANNHIKCPAYGDFLLTELTRAFKDEVLMVASRVNPRGWFFKPLDQAELKYVYTQGDRQDLAFPRHGGIEGTEGTPLISNNEGLVYGENHNATLRFSSRMEYGPFFSAYLEPIALFRENRNNDDDLQTAELRLHKGYVKLNISPETEILIGRDSIWWGQGFHGTMIFSNNARPLDMIKLSQAIPVQLPWVLKFLGPTKYSFFFSELEGDRVVQHPTLLGMRLNIKPVPWLELGATVSILGQGEGQPDWNGDDLGAIFLFSDQFDQADHGFKQCALDFRVRLPFLKNTEMYGQWAGVGDAREGDWDQHGGPGVFSDAAAMFGVYVPWLTPNGRTDLRFEYAGTSNWNEADSGALWYSHSKYGSGMTWRGLLLGHHAGGDARDYFLRVTHAPSDKWVLGLDFERMERGFQKVLNDRAELETRIGLDAEYQFKENMRIVTRYIHGNVSNLNFESDNDQIRHSGWLAYKLSF